MPTNTEDSIYRDPYRYIRAHSTPPPIADTDASASCSAAAADDISKVSARWENHPLAIKLLIAVYEYLEEKAKEAGT